MKPTDQPLINPEIICRDDFDDTLVLFHAHLGQAIPVAGFARDLWRALDGTHPLDAIARELAAQYAQSPDTVLDFPKMSSDHRIINCRMMTTHHHPRRFTMSRSH